MLLLRVLVALSKRFEVLFGYFWVHCSVVLIRVDPLGRVEVVLAVITVLVVPGALIWVGKDLVCLVQLLEVFSSLWVIWVLVRVLEQGQLSVGLLNLDLSRGLLQVEDVVQNCGRGSS